MLVIKQLMPIDFHSIYFPIMEVIGDQKTVWFFKILQNIFFCVHREKETYTGLERCEGE